MSTHACYRWHACHIKQLADTAKDGRIVSRSFSFADHKFALLYFPGGFGVTTHASCYLYCQSIVADMPTFSFTIGIVGPDGALVTNHKAMSRVYEATKGTAGYQQFSDKFVASKVNDSIVIQIIIGTGADTAAIDAVTDITDFQWIGVETISLIQKKPSSREFLYKTRVASDISICIADAEIPCHKAFLMAGSEYFHRLFASDKFVEGGKQQLTLEVNLHAFELLLEYIYLEQLRVPNESAELAGFVVLWDRLQMGNLADAITVTNNNVFGLLDGTISAPGQLALQEKCVAHILLNYLSIHWDLHNGITIECLFFIIETFISKLFKKQVVDIDILCCNICHWFLYDPQRKEHIKQCVEHDVAGFLFRFANPTEYLSGTYSGESLTAMTIIASQLFRECVKVPT